MDVGARGVMMFSRFVESTGAQDVIRMDVITSRVKKHRDDLCALYFDFDRVVVLVNLFLFILFANNVRFCGAEDIRCNNFVAFH